MTTKSTLNLYTFSTVEELTGAAAGYVSALSAQAIAVRGRFTVALSGGSLPKLLGPGLVVEPLRSQINWPAWHVFWADERCVPLTSSESNYRPAYDYLFKHVNIPVAQIYTYAGRLSLSKPTQAEHPHVTLAPDAAARAYQATLDRVFQPRPGQPPCFDLILLGMGEDGHTASLFPHHPLLMETDRWVAPIFDSPKPPPARITLTLPVINQARQVAFLVAGAAKAGTLNRVLGPAASPGALPAQMVRPIDGELSWFVCT